MVLGAGAFTAYRAGATKARPRGAEGTLQEIGPLAPSAAGDLLLDKMTLRQRTLNVKRTD